MDNQNRPSLSLGSIADEWASDLEESKVPGRLSCDEIFLELIRAVWRCDFEDENGENTVLFLHQPPKGGFLHRPPKGGASVGHKRYVDANRKRTGETRLFPYTRRQLLYHVQGAGGIKLPATPRLFPSPDDKQETWAGLAREVPWGDLITLELDEYLAIFLAIAADLTISKENFRRWCDCHRHAPPAFWFSRTNPSADGTTDADVDQPEAAVGQDAKINDGEHEAKTQTGGRPSREQLEGWYPDHVTNFRREHGIAPNRDHDLTAARAKFGRQVKREQIADLRRKFLPEDITKGGAPTK